MQQLVNITNLNHDDLQRRQLNKQIDHLTILIAQEQQKLSQKEMLLNEIDDQINHKLQETDELVYQMEDTTQEDLHQQDTLNQISHQKQSQQKQLLMVLSLKNCELSSMELNLNELDSELLKLQSDSENLKQDLFDKQQTFNNQLQQHESLENELNAKQTHKQDLDRRLHSLKKANKEYYQIIQDLNEQKQHKENQIENVHQNLIERLEAKSQSIQQQRQKFHLHNYQKLSKYLEKIQNQYFTQNKLHAMQRISQRSGLTRRRRIHLLILNSLFKKRLQMGFRRLHHTQLNLGLRIQDELEEEIQVTRDTKKLGSCFNALKRISYETQNNRIKFSTAFYKLQFLTQNKLKSYLQSGFRSIHKKQQKKNILTRLIRHMEAKFITFKLQKGFRRILIEYRQSQHHSDIIQVAQEQKALRFKFKIFQLMKDSILHSKMEQKVQLLHMFKCWRSFTRKQWIHRVEKNNNEVFRSFHGLPTMNLQNQAQNQTYTINLGDGKINHLLDVIDITGGMLAQKKLKRLAMIYLRQVTRNKSKYLRKWQKYVQHQNDVASDLNYLLQQGLSNTKLEVLKLLQQHMRKSQTFQIQAIQDVNHQTMLQEQDRLQDLNQQVIDSSVLRDYLNLIRVVMLRNKQIRFLKKKYFQVYQRRCMNLKKKQRSTTKLMTFVDRRVKRVIMERLYDCLQMLL